MAFDLDRRTRCDADRRTIACDEFFTNVFPGLADIHGAIVAAGMERLDAPPLTVEVGGSAWTIRRTGSTVEAIRGRFGGALTVTLTEDQFSDWAQNEVTFNGYLVMRDLRFRGGAIADVSSWDSLWIALLDGWPVVGDSLRFLGRDGAPLNLAASFTSADDPAEIAHFLRETGFLLLNGWLAQDDAAGAVADMDRALPRYAEGDGKSWWATLSDGSRCCVRMQDFVRHSPATARMLGGSAWKRLRQVLAGPDRLVDSPSVEALFKPVGIVSGPSDLSFHRDCHLGRHSYVCSHLTVGIALTATSKANGLLRVVAGSHRVAMPVSVAVAKPYLPIVSLPTEPGDLTIHLSCTLHESTRPTVAERRVLYAGMALRPLDRSDRQPNAAAKIREQISDIFS